MLDISVAQFLADDPRQTAVCSFGNVCHLKLRGIQLIAGAQCADDGDISPHGGLNQAQLAGNQVNTICDIVVALGEKFFFVCTGEGRCNEICNLPPLK